MTFIENDKNIHKGYRVAIWYMTKGWFRTMPWSL